MTDSTINPDDRRQYLRMKIMSQAELRSDDSETIDIKCRDLSAGGAQIQLDKPLDVSASYHFVLTPNHPNGQPLHADASIVWSSCTKHEQEETYTYGLRFNNVK